MYIIWGYMVMDEIIKVDNLMFRYNDLFIFDKFNLHIKRGEWLTISGSNGSGKSTLIKIITGILKSNCKIVIDNLELNNENLFEIRRNIGVVFDNLDDMFLCETVEDEIAFSLENLSYSRKQIKERIDEISDVLNIRKLLHKSTNELSGGEKFKVALACVLSFKPRILIIDESLSLLDNNDKSNILNLLKTFNDNGLTIINITHNLEESYNSDRLIILNNGEIVLDGPPIKVFEYDKVLTKLGIKLPFEVELSIKLKLYGLIDNIIPSIDNMVNKLWE
jgi:energy-coupling factor transport system ATP-binding protein